MLRQRTLALVAVTALSTGFLTACPSGGRLENGELHDATVDCPDTAVLLETYCAGSACHSPRPNRTPPDNLPKGGVDLTTPEGIAQMYNGDATYPTIQCERKSNPEKLVDPTNPTEGLLYLKLVGKQSCGEPMPLSGVQPSAYEMFCLRKWALDLAANPPSGVGGASPMGGAANGGAK